MEQVDNGFTLEVTNASFITDSEVEMTVVALGNPNAWEVVQRSFDSNKLFKNGESLDFEMGHPDLEAIKNPRDKLLRLFEVDETLVCFTLKQWIPTDAKNVFILRGYVTGPFGPTLKEALVNRDKPVYFGTRCVTIQNGYILGVDWIQSTKRKFDTPDIPLQARPKSIANRKHNWVVYNPESGYYLGRVKNPDAENYPLPGESDTVWGWVKDLQKAKSDWIVRPALFLLRLSTGLNIRPCEVKVVQHTDNQIVLKG